MKKNYIGLFIPKYHTQTSYFWRVNMQIKIFTTKMDLLSGLCVAKQLLTVQPNFVKKKNVTTKYSFFYVFQQQSTVAQ